MPYFNASNLPGTCLWCGRKLRMTYSTVWKRVLVTVKRCPKCNGRRLLQTCEGAGYYCSDCQEYTAKGSRRQVVSRIPVYDKPGLGGTGLFDTGICEADFGRNAARLGFRLHPAREDR